MLEREQALATDLVKRLAAVGVASKVTDKRHVKATSGEREVRVFCIYYEPAVSALMLGINPANARRSLGRAMVPREGAEYVVDLHAGLRVTTDRTADVEQVVACARAWLAGRPIDEVERETPFVGAKYRRASALAATLDPSLRYSIGGDPSWEVWAYGDGRSCKLDRGCAFWLGQAQVAYGEIGEPAAAVKAWLVERVAMDELGARFPEIAIERHAQLLESDPARWHWLHLRERATSPGDVLAPLRELIEALAERPAVTAFYSYSSLWRLCFTASSHFPWVDDGLPTVWRNDDDYIIHTYHEDGIALVTCDLALACATIEARLVASSVRPFFGSEPNHLFGPLADALARRGSVLHPAIVQHGEWPRLEVAKGSRRCEVSGRALALHDGGEPRRMTVGSLDEAAAAICELLDS